MGQDYRGAPRPAMARQDIDRTNMAIEHGGLALWIDPLRGRNLRRELELIR